MGAVAATQQHGHSLRRSQNDSGWRCSCATTPISITGRSVTSLASRPERCRPRWPRLTRGYEGQSKECLTMRADSDFSPAVAELLDRYTPVPQTEPNWDAIRAQDVTSAAKGTTSPCPSGRGTCGDRAGARSRDAAWRSDQEQTWRLSAWLQGTPGEPVSEEEQRAFDQANATWGSVPWLAAAPAARRCGG